MLRYLQVVIQNPHRQISGENRFDDTSWTVGRVRFRLSSKVHDMHLQHTSRIWHRRVEGQLQVQAADGGYLSLINDLQYSVHPMLLT